MHSFYMYLKSNASTDLYPENKLTAFKNQLPRILHVEGYKIALQTLYLDNKYGNIPNSILGTTGHFLLFSHGLPPTVCNITNHTMSSAAFVSAVKSGLVGAEKSKRFEIGMIKENKIVHITLRRSYLLIHPQVNKYFDFNGELVKHNGLDYIKLDSRRSNGSYMSNMDFPTKPARPSLIRVQLHEMRQNLSGLKLVQDLAIIKAHPRVQYPIHSVCKRKEYFNLNCTSLSTLSVRLVDEDNYPLQLSSGQATLLKVQLKKFPMKSSVLRLSSLESADIFPDNTNSSFRIKLSHPLQVENWDVALSSIYLPAQTDLGRSLTAENFYIEIQKLDEFESIEVVRLPLHDLQHFTTEGFVKYLQWKMAITFEEDAVPFQVDVDEGKMYFLFNDDDITVTLSGMLAYLLNSAASPQEPVSTIGRNRVRLLIGTPNFKKLHPHVVLVHCNFITPIVVGNEFGETLKMVPYYDSDSDDATIMKYEAEHLDFQPLSMNDPSMLHFEMRNAVGEYITFSNADAEIMLTLVFREKMNKY